MLFCSNSIQAGSNKATIMIILKIDDLIGFVDPPDKERYYSSLVINQEPTETSKQPIRTRYLGHVTGYHPIRGKYFLIRSVPEINPDRSEDEVKVHDQSIQF
eukprot:sb/3478346/